MISTNARDRGYIDTMSDRAFMFMLGFYVFFGLYLDILVSSMTYRWHSPNFVMMLVLGLGIPFAGITLSRMSSNWMLSSVGYLLVVVPFGILLGPMLAMYNAASVLQAFTVTMVVAGGMWIVGVAIPPVAKNWSAFIVGALLLFIGGNVVSMIMPLFHMQPVFMGVLPWIGAILFSALIVYDINKAMQLPKTPDNAVDSAVGVYLDIFNLFIQLLQIFGRRDD